jgi:hypothetical protein
MVRTIYTEVEYILVHIIFLKPTHNGPSKLSLAVP